MEGWNKGLDHYYVCNTMHTTRVCGRDAAYTGTIDVNTGNRPLVLACVDVSTARSWETSFLSSGRIRGVVSYGGIVSPREV